MPDIYQIDQICQDISHYIIIITNFERYTAIIIEEIKEKTEKRKSEKNLLQNIMEKIEKEKGFAEDR